MKTIVFGSTGGTGRAVVEAALAAGHTVTAFARDPAKLVLEHPRLTKARGDVLDAASVERTVPGHDAVVCALGTPATTRNTVRSQGTGHIVRAMEAAAVRRLVVVSSIGIGDSKPMLPALYRFVLVPLLLRQGFAEHELQEACVRASRTDWTIVRPGALTNGPRTGEFQRGAAVNGHRVRAKISRADVATFVVEQLGDARWLHATPWISY